MTTLKPIKLKLYKKWADDKTITFKTNLGTDLTIIDYDNGVMTIETEPGMSIHKQAEIVEACFLPGSDFTKRGSMFVNFREIKFTFNDMDFSITKANCSAKEIVRNYFFVHG